VMLRLMGSMYLRYTGRPEGRLAIVGWLVDFSLWFIEQTEV
jgi:hypothetical protein